MQQQNQNKEFILTYFNALVTDGKSKEVLEKYTTDEELIAHINFFEGVFPGYEVTADEITAEGNKVVVKARFKGVHEGEFNGIAPTHRTIEFPFAISYEIENEKIVHHWMIVDRMAMIEQLGAIPVEEAVH